MIDHQPLPQRVVVVGAVEAQRVDPGAPAVQVAHRESAQHRHLEAQIDHGVFQRFDRFLGGGGGDGGHRHQAVAEAVINVGGVAVPGPAHPPADLVVALAGHHQPPRRVAEGQVQSQLVQPAIHQLRSHGRGQVVGVGERDTPPRLAERPHPGAILGGHLGPVGTPVEGARGPQRVQPLADALVPHIAIQVGPVLPIVAVAVHHRMVEPLSDIGGRHLTHGVRLVIAP